MVLKHRRIPIMFVVLVMSALLGACGSPPPAQVARATVVVTAVPQAPAAATATPRAAAAPTLAPVPSATGKPLAPSPTPPRLLVAGIPGDKDRIDGQIVYPDYGAGARTDLVFQVKARDPRKGKQDGAGIKSVDFKITDKSGQVVYTHPENNSLYCAFGGGDNGAPCTVFRFADNGFRWPGTNKPIQNGQHTLSVSVHPQSGDDWPDGTVNFQIQR